jgi:integrating conjugative element protein (TIGR03758 family)
MQRRTPSRPFFGLLLYFSVIAAVWSALTYADFLHDLGVRESGLKPAKVNGYGYTGLFQMGEAAMIDAGYYKSDGTAKNDWKGVFTGKNGISSLNDFKNNPDAQIKAIADYEAVQWNVIQNLGLSSYIGQTINGVQITQSGLIAGAHLVGYGGLQKYLSSNGTKDVPDGNGTPISQYIQKFGGYTIGGGIPSYAAVAAAAGSSGLPSAGTPVAGTPVAGRLGGGTGAVGLPSLPAAPAPTDASPDEAFFQNTGYQYSDVSTPIKEFLAASLFLWLVWTMLGTWKAFTAGGMTMMELKQDMVRALIVLSLGVMLVS